MKTKRERLKLAATIIITIIAFAWLISGDGSRLEPSIEVINSVGILVILAWNEPNAES